MRSRKSAGKVQQYQNVAPTFRLLASYLGPDSDNAEFSSSFFWVVKHSQLGSPCSKSLRIKLLLSENALNQKATDLHISKDMDFSIEENKIFEVGSLLCISVRTKLMAVGRDLHRFKGEKVIEMVYASLKEVSL